MTTAAADLPAVTDAHRHAAYEAMGWRYRTYEAAMAEPLTRKIIECRAAQMRTAEWRATQRRSVVPVRRVRLGADGHPVWCTQLASGPLESADLFPT